MAVYKTTVDFPKSETYGLTSQFRRAAVSIPANITEGFKRTHRADKARFMNIAQSSLEECRYYLILTEEIGYCKSSSLLSKLEEVSKLLDAYSRSIIDSAM